MRNNRDMTTCTRRVLLGRIAAAAAAAATLAPSVSAARVAYQKRVLAKHPVAYWRLDEPSGATARDLSNNAHEGSYRGGVIYRQRSAVQDEPAGAIGLNGVDAYVEVPDSTAFSQATSGRGLSVEAWFRPDRLRFSGQTSEHYVHWLGKGEAGAYEWGFRFYSQDSSRPNRVSAYLWNLSSQRGASNEGAGAYFEDQLRPGAWLHVVACFDPGDAGNRFAGVSIYKNAVLRHGPAASRGARYASYDIHPRHGPAPVRLGTRDQSTFLAGGLSDVAIYPRVLTAGEILDNFSGA